MTKTLRIVSTVAVAVTALAAMAAAPDQNADKEALNKSIRQLAEEASINESLRQNADQAAINKAIRSYVKAFNQGNADAVAALFAETGQWITPSGKRLVGRDAIRKEMADYFADAGKPRLEVIKPTIRFVAPTVAVEEGHARVACRGEEPIETSYLALHVKRDGNWQVESIRETTVPRPAGGAEQLEQLAWMVGAWIDRDGETLIETSCQWTANRKFLTRSFSVVADNQVVMSGTQVIGWDAATGQVRSWLFDSEGGVAEGMWRREGDRWFVKIKQTLRDGRLASSLNVITRVNDDAMTWQSTNREIDGQLQPNLGPVTVHRQ